jgi:hypothetical protein
MPVHHYKIVVMANLMFPGFFCSSFWYQIIPDTKLYIKSCKRKYPTLLYITYYTKIEYLTNTMYEVYNVFNIILIHYVRSPCDLIIKVAIFGSALGTQACLSSAAGNTD